MGPYKTTEEMLEANKKSKEPVDFGDNTVFPTVYAGRYFIAGKIEYPEYNAGTFYIFSCSDKGIIERMPVGNLHNLDRAEEMAGWLSKPGPWKYVSAIIVANKKAGNNFFDEKTMRVWQSRIYEVYGGRFLVTSEKERYSTRGRGYAVRSVNNDGTNISKLEDWYDSLPEARRVAKLLTKEISPCS